MSGEVPMSDAAVRRAAVEFGIVAPGTTALAPDERAETLDTLSEKGIESDHERWPSTTECPPPRRDPDPFNADERHAEFHNRYETFINSDTISIWADPPGTGKTTTAARAAAERDRSHVIFFPTHEKAREHLLDDATPDEYLHLKGAEQPLHDCCLDAKIDAGPNESAVCPEPGHEDGWPRMCPIYEFDDESEYRKQFEAYASARTYHEAHDRFCPDDACSWSTQFADLGERERIVTVQEYQPHFTGRNHDPIVDEPSGPLTETDRYSVMDLMRAQALLRSLSSKPYAGMPSNPLATTLAEFVDELIDAVRIGDMGAITPPEFDTPCLAEPLARLKVEHNDHLVRDIEHDHWDGTPPCFDALLAALAECGVAPEACREAIAGPSTLDRCPRCRAPTTGRDGVLVCPNCIWKEDRFTILDYPSERRKAKVDVSIETDDHPDVDENRLRYDRRIHPDDLPDAPLLLDATATPRKIAGRYGVSRDAVEVHGDAPIEMAAEIVQIRDGQYHPGTIAAAFDDEDRRLDKRLKAALETICAEHEDVLVVTKRDLLQRFDVPENATTRHYHAIRGLNMEAHDAVVCIGAPHPNPAGIKRQARLLAMDHDDLRVGGEEYGTRSDDNPPIYRRIYYEDADGQGRAVRTKAYSGLTSDLFREKREDELVQVVHRVRPVLADFSDPKNIYLITNVPTELPVDAFVDLDALTNPSLRSLLPVPEGAITYLLEPLYDVLTGDEPEGFTDDMVLDRTDDRIVSTKRKLHAFAEASGAEVTYKTVAGWVNDLEALGLLTHDGYEYRKGDRFIADRATLTRALLVITSTTSGV